MAWGDGIRPEDKIYKYKRQHSTNSDTAAIIMILLVIAVAISYLAFSKYRERQEAEELIKHLNKQTTGEYYVKQAVKSLGNTIENLTHPAGERQVIYTSNQDSQRMNFEIGKIQPQYPHYALTQGYEGFVTYKVNLSRYGVIEEIKLAKSSGYESLDTAALKAIKRSAFTPPNLLIQHASTLYITCGFQSKKTYCQY